MCSFENQAFPELGLYILQVFFIFCLVLQHGPECLETFPAHLRQCWRKQSEVFFAGDGRVRWEQTRRFFFFSSACDCLITSHFWIGSRNQLLRAATLLDGGACCQNPLSSLHEETDSWITVEWAAQSLGQLIPLCEKSNPGSICELGESDWQRHGGVLVAPLVLHRISGQ